MTRARTERRKKAWADWREPSIGTRAQQRRATRAMLAEEAEERVAAERAKYDLEIV